MQRHYRLPAKSSSYTDRKRKFGRQVRKGERGIRILAPVRRRKDGWSFVIADAEDRKRLLRMTVDGEPALVCAGNGLVDCNRLNYMADLADHVVPRVSRAMEFPKAMKD